MSSDLMSGDLMSRKQARAQLAGLLGVIGGAVGMLAGLVQATVGAHIPQWTGNKDSPVPLGLLTIVLSALAVFCALGLRRRRDATTEQRIVAVLGLLVPGALCFSTVGALWYLPGSVLVVAGVCAITALDRHEARAVIGTNWLRALVSALGASELLMAVSAGSAVPVLVGVVGGIALVAALWLPSVQLRTVFLVLGTVPFAALTWWSLVSPLVAVLALGTGVSAVRSGRRPARTA